MGNVSFGAPRDVIKRISATFQITTFVETGTYRGGTASWASEHFAQVFTIEGSPDLLMQAQELHGDRTNIQFLLGDSRSKLPEVISRLNGMPALFWLDAHWMPGSYGEAHECPLLSELEIIHQSEGEHFILIDDARLFLAPPPRPHLARDWPNIEAVLSVLNAPGRPSRYTVVHNDVIFSLPGFARETMQEFFQEQTTAAYLAMRPPLPNVLVRLTDGIRRRVARIMRLMFRQGKPSSDSILPQR